MALERIAPVTPKHQQSHLDKCLQHVIRWTKSDAGHLKTTTAKERLMRLIILLALIAMGVASVLGIESDPMIVSSTAAGYLISWVYEIALEMD